MAVDSFTILELINQSPTTSIYKAHQNVLDRTVLLKVLHKHLLKDKDLVARFRREAKACAILRSENIVQVYDLTEVEGAPAIVMEYVEGKSLDEAILDPDVRPGELFDRVAVSVLNALAYAHERGVVHRDIKPGNILVSADGVIKVTDFGLAAVSDAPSLTIDGTLIGTPAYMSPEQSRGEAVDNRTDLFSLGVTLVEVLTGKKILAGRSYTECISKIQAFELSSLDSFKLQCSPHVLEFLKGLLAPAREGRFPSASDALKFLLESAGGEASRSGAVATPSESGKSAELGRKRLLTIGVGIILVIVVGLSLVLSRPAQKPRINNAVSPSDSIGNSIAGKGRGSTDTGADTSRKSNSGERKMVATGNQSEGKGGYPASREQYGHESSSVKSDSGYISIACTPWAKIFIDNEYAGRTPISGSIKVPAGRHTVTFNNPYFAPIVEEVDVHSKVLASVDVNFLKDAGYLFINVHPWGEVYVDDQWRETTPSSKPIVVSPGIRHLKIQNPAFHDIMRDLNVKPGDTLRLNFSFLENDEN